MRPVTTKGVRSEGLDTEAAPNWDPLHRPPYRQNRLFVDEGQQAERRASGHGWLRAYTR